MTHYLLDNILCSMSISHLTGIRLIGSCSIYVKVALLARVGDRDNDLLLLFAEGSPQSLFLRNMPSVHLQWT